MPATKGISQEAAENSDFLLRNRLGNANFSLNQAKL
jgi:hypothetical protein